MTERSTRELPEAAERRGLSVGRAEEVALTPGPFVPEGAEFARHAARRSLPVATTRSSSAPIGSEAGYYGIPMLQRPVWGPEVALYFFFGGISAGAFTLGALASLVDEERYEEVTRAAWSVAFLALLPCPPLLIDDLGRPERFHHMMRIWKPSSPMNLGAWTLAGYGALATLAAAGELARSSGRLPRPVARLARLLPRKVTGALGLPFSLMLASYTGVLLETTSNPAWAQSPFLGPLFTASAFSTGAAATGAALAIVEREPGGAALRALHGVERIASMVEVASLAGHIAKSGSGARSLTRGGERGTLLLAVGAGVAASVLKRLLAPSSIDEGPVAGLPGAVADDEPPRSQGGRRRRGLAVALASGLALLSGLALRWAIVHAGHDAAGDVGATLDATRPTEEATGWVRG